MSGGADRPRASPFNTLVELLQERAAGQPDQPAYVFLEAGEKEGARISYAELACRAQAVAARLQATCPPGSRALLLYPPGLDFLPAFFGCLYAGVIAVPCYPPRRNRRDHRLAAIAEDSEASVILTSAEIASQVSQRLTHNPELSSTQWIATETLDSRSGEGYRAPQLGPETTAFLQYTSGSTSTPKGVAVSHGNLLHNLANLDQDWQHTPESVMVTWLPIFHDMGLIYGALMPIFKGFLCVMIPPAAFLQRPLRWLEAISYWRGTHSAAPNFAYDLCVSTTTPEQRAALDLRSWRLASNAAEPIRPHTIDAFAEAFSAAGFNREAVCGAYGLAEGTLELTKVLMTEPKTVSSVDRAALANHRVVVTAPNAEGAQPLATCGRARLGTSIVIVDSERRIECAPDRVGEVWAAGPSVAKGYWNRPAETAETFGARLADTGAGPYLRTGDLGFIHEGELFVTGRVKDLIIIHGCNFYPQDIELSAERSHPALRAGCAAAFPMEIGGQERLVIAVEIERTALRNLQVDAVTAAIRGAVGESHDLQPSIVVLLRTGSIPKTSSGKIQRRACKARLLEGTLEIVGEWRAPIHAAETAPSPHHATTAETSATLHAWLEDHLTRELRLAKGAIDPQKPFQAYGLDSMGAVRLAAALEVRLGRKLEATIVYDFPTCEALTSHLFPGARTVAPKRETAESAEEAIAIVGFGCRFPKAHGPQAFWELLRTGGDAVEAMSFPRFSSGSDGECREFAGGFLDRVADFDAEFFGISPREADRMDPQQRLVLEIAWEALEHTGLPPAELAGSETGVFLGISTQDYLRLQRSEDTGDAYASTGNSLSIAANRVSYLLDLRGPSWAVDTACSSSLVALHQACKSLRDGECDLALAGGVNLILSPDVNEMFSRAGMLSRSSRCRAFDAGADGFVRSEGCGMVVLARLSEARRRGLPVRALIRGTAVNQDGRSNGLTAPNGSAQRALLRRALAAAQVSAGEIGYVEAHGTGTALGDPIEAGALREVLGASEADEPCYLGSVKTNLGHLEAAAGIAGLLKVVLALEHGQIPAHLHFRQLNPHLSFAGSRLRLPLELTPWPGNRRLAGVSSFGFGGTNAHVILEGAPQEASVGGGGETPRRMEVLALSARSPQALAELVRAYAKLLAGPLPCTLGELCAAANAGRSHFAECRLALVSDSLPGLRDQLTRAGQADFTGPSAHGSAHAATSDAAGHEAERLAVAYAAGAIIDWADHAAPRRSIAALLPTYPFQRRSHWFSPAPTSRADESPAVSPILEKLRVAADHERHQLLSGFLREELAAVLGLPDPHAISSETGFFALGLDSIMAVELEERLTLVLGLRLKPTTAFEYPNIEFLTRHLLLRLTPEEAGGPARSDSKPEGHGHVAAERYVTHGDSLLAAKLSRLEGLVAE